MSWSNRFVGIPFADLGRSRDGCDCWGLACVIYRERLGILLPDYAGYASTDEQAEVAAVVAGAVTSPLWEQVGIERPYDIALFRRGPLTTHVGIVVMPGLMIHIADEDAAKIEDYRAGRWKHRLVGFHRWRGSA